MRRRTRALTEIIAAMLGLLFQVSVLRWTRNNEEAPAELAGVSVFGLAAGALYRGVHPRIRDRDLGGVETSPYRRFLFGVIPAKETGTPMDDGVPEQFQCR